MYLVVVLSPSKEICAYKLIIRLYHFIPEVRGGAFGFDIAQEIGKLWVRFPMKSLKFFIDLILPAALWPCG